jgi:ABC-type nitrate/sulfonate/bicarbonate transport system substrate-binding protein
MKTKLITLVILILIGIILFKVCTQNDNKVKQVNFATSKNMWCALGLIANENGYFADEGLKVNIKYLDAGKYCLDALVSNSVEFATIVEVNIAYYGFTGDTSVEIIASLVNSTSSGIVVRKSSNILKPEDLKGKTLAFSPGTTSDIFANWFLEKYNLSSSNVELMKIQPNAIVGAMTSKSIDAASTWDPHIYNIKKIMGNDIIEFRDSSVYTGYLNLAIRKKWGSQNSETVEAFLRALKKAELFVKNNKGEAQKIISKVINLDLEIVKGTWQYHDMELKLNKTQMTNAINKIGQWAIKSMENFKNKKLPNFQNYVNDSYLKEINK